jgi:serine protease inhibitor
MRFDDVILTFAASRVPSRFAAGGGALAAAMIVSAFWTVAATRAEDAEEILPPPIGLKSNSTVLRVQGDFVTRLYRASSGIEGNLGLCPPSALTAFAMLHDDPRARLSDDLSQFFSFPSSKDAFEEFVRKSPRIEPSRGCKSLQANSYWYDPAHHAPDDVYRGRLKSLFGAEARPFAAPADTAKSINEWAKTASAGKIEELVSADEVQQSLAMIFSIVYFKGAWQKPFDPQDTKDAPFRLSKDKSVDVPFMRHLSERYECCRTDRFVLTVLPFGDGDRHSMVFVVPVGDLDPASLMQQVTFRDLLAARKQMRTFDGNILIPRFSASSTLKLDELLGVKGRDDAPSRNILRDLNQIHGEHRVLVDVNEAGAEAVGSTKISLPNSAYPNFDFIADRPFVYFILDASSDSILFVGRVVDPSKR